MQLIIVESPTKARTLSRFLGSGYRIEATMGHIRDLPQKKLGVNINDNFEPEYAVAKEKKKTVEHLKALVAEGMTDVVLATDLDREGEAIAYHVKHVLSSRSKIKNQRLKFSRIVFHEITKTAIEEALKNPRDIDMPLVDAQQGRRVLDRLVGYKLSPVLWYKTGKNWLSAGRVQSVAVRLIVEREREIAAFIPEEYWKISAKCKVQSAKIEEKNKEFIAELVMIDEKKAEVHTKNDADSIVADLEKATYRVDKVQKDMQWRTPPPAFITSTLQRAGATLFGWPARKTMTVAQNLYEEGLITYHRTDSVQLSKEAVDMVRGFINKTYGTHYLSPQARIYKTKSKVAQEAHEAIRPTSLEVRSQKYEVRSERSELGRDHAKLLDLITKRFVACQMAEQAVEKTTVDVRAGTRYVLQAKGENVLFEGWKRVYEERSKISDVSIGVRPQASDKDQRSNPPNRRVNQIQNSNEENGRNNEGAEQTTILPVMAEGEAVDLIKILSEQKFTQPKARYNEASLIKALEDHGIGRPSTYAPIISTIQARQYVEKIDGRAFKPTDLGMMVNDFLVEHFGAIINIAFTAGMEDKLDRIAKGELLWQTVIRDFWTPFEATLLETRKKVVKIEMPLEETGEKCPQDGGELVIRIGRFGKFAACRNFPNCKFTKPMVIKIDVLCPKCGGDMLLKKTRKGRKFYGCGNYPACDFASWQKPSQTRQATGQPAQKKKT